MTFLIGIAAGIFFIGWNRSLSRRIDILRQDARKEIVNLVRRIEVLESGGAKPAAQEEQPVPQSVPQPEPVHVPAPQPIVQVPQLKPEVKIYEERPPREPSEIEKKIKEFITGGNMIVKVGVLLIFFGVSFLLKIAIDKGLFPIELRLTAAAAVGFALIHLGWRLRTKAADYALVVQGGGIGVLYLTTFVALKVYSLINAPLAFLLLVGYTAAAVYLAVLQNSRNLAGFAFTGGFLAPILVSTGQGQHVVLFSYYALLNLAILAISWKKAWRILNVLGFVFTYGIGTVWGVLKYNADHYWTTQPFLILFFATYLAIPILFARNQKPELKGYVDGTLVFGNALIVLFLQLKLASGFEYGGAFSAMIIAGVYLSISRYLIQHGNEYYKMLAQAFLAIGVVAATIAIPLAFDGVKTSAIWALEAAGIYWYSLRQNQKVARGFATLLALAMAISFFLGPKRSGDAILFLNSFYMSCALIGLALISMAYTGKRFIERLSEEEKIVPLVVFVVGAVYLVMGGLSEIFRHFHKLGYSGFLQKNDFPSAFLVYSSILACLGLAVAREAKFDYLRKFAQLLVLPMLYVAVVSLDVLKHGFQHYGWAAWIFAFGAYYWILKNNDRHYTEASQPKIIQLGHAAWLWVLLIVLTDELIFVESLGHGLGSAWKVASGGFLVAAFTMAVIMLKNKTVWPFYEHYRTYITWGLAPILTFGWVFLVVSNWKNSGASYPIFYVPGFNPMDLTLLGIIGAMSLWAIEAKKIGEVFSEAAIKNLFIIIGATIFIWFNGAISRSVHHYFSVPYEFDTLFKSVELQVSLSIFWTLLGISVMVTGTKKTMRWLWIVGASLLGVVVVKMFLIDLSKTNTVARVISFLGVGILFLVVGYFSPIPPEKKEA